MLRKLFHIFVNHGQSTLKHRLQYMWNLGGNIALQPNSTHNLFSNINVTDEDNEKHENWTDNKQDVQNAFIRCFSSLFLYDYVTYKIEVNNMNVHTGHPLLLLISFNHHTANKCRQTNRQMRQTDRQTNRQMRQTDRQSEKQLTVINPKCTFVPITKVCCSSPILTFRLAQILDTRNVS